MLDEISTPFIVDLTPFISFDLKVWANFSILVSGCSIGISTKINLATKFVSLLILKE